MKNGVLAALLVATLVVAVFGTDYFISSQQAPRATPTGSSSSSIEGLILNASISSKTLNAGGTLGISISLYNSLSTGLNLSTVTYGSSSWKVNGLPVAMWGSGCNGLEPVEFMIVKGNFSVGELEAASVNASYPEMVCMEGGSILYASFLPMSTNATTSGYFCTAVCSPYHESFNLSTSFSVNGYWAYPLNNSEANDIYTPADCYNQSPCGTTYNYPEVGPEAQHTFTSGWYTLVVSDEWGQVVTLNFEVDG